MQRSPFDLIAPFYDRVFRFRSLEGLADFLQLRPPARLLDLGGGTGRVAQRFGRGFVVVVCDSSWGMLQQACRKGVNACLARAEYLPFGDGAFDGVVIVDAFHHFGNLEMAAGEAVRVLAPGGRLVIEEPDIRRCAVRLVALGERLLLMKSRFCSPADLVSILKEAGAEVDAIEEDGGVSFRLAAERHRPGVNSRGVRGEDG